MHNGWLLLHACLTGAVLTLVGALVSHGRTLTEKHLAESSNALFLCFGMAGLILLVNNNIARAFAVGAAVALVRFRIKVDTKSIPMTLFYAVLSGLACGAGQPAIAWAIALMYGVLHLAVLATRRFLHDDNVAARHPGQPPSPSGTPDTGEALPLYPRRAGLDAD